MLIMMALMSGPNQGRLLKSVSGSPLMLRMIEGIIFDARAFLYT